VGPNGRQHLDPLGGGAHGDWRVRVGGHGVRQVLWIYICTRSGSLMAGFVTINDDINNG
jgi:hypothetical protein